MRDVLDDRTIVLVGSWNVAILNPDWIARTLLEADGVNAEIILSEGRTRLKYLNDDMSITPEAGRVIIAARKGSDQCLQLTETLATKLLRELPITPVTAVGINFGYAQEEVPENIAGIFNSADMAPLAQRGLAVREIHLMRHLVFEDRELRLRLSRTAENTLRVHANFHKGVATADAGREAIANKALDYKNATERILREVFNLEREANNAD